MPEEKDPMRVAAHKSGAVHDIRIARENGLQQYIVFLGIVFQIGILDQDIIPARVLDPCMHGRTLALVLWLAEILNGGLGVVHHIFLDHEVGIVLRAIIDDDDLLLDMTDQFHIAHFVQQDGNGRCLVIYGNDNGQSADGTIKGRAFDMFGGSAYGRTDPRRWKSLMHTNKVYKNLVRSYFQTRCRIYIDVNLFCYECGIKNRIKNKIDKGGLIWSKITKRLQPGQGLDVYV